MEKLRLYRYLKNHARGVTVALSIAAASTILLAPPETYAQNSAEKPTTSPNPTTPALEFETPGLIRSTRTTNQRLVRPAFIPMPEVHLPQWTGEARITFYCLEGDTASQTPVREGVIATDPKVIPTGSLVDIEGIGNDFSAEDTGDGVKGWHIDLWKASCEEAINSGSQRRRIRVK